MSTIRKGTISKGTISTGFAFKSELAVTGELKFNLLGDYDFTPSENATPNALLLQGTISSGSSSGAVTFTLDDDAEGRISIASTGNKTFSLATTGVGFNHSTSPSHTFKVRAVDSDGDIITRSGTIVLTDVDNAPTITATDFAGNRNNFHADVLPGVAIAGGNGNELRSISTDKQSVFTLSGSQADDHLLIPDTDGLGAVVTAKRIIPHGGSANTEFGPTGVETPAAGDATYTAEEKGDADTDTSTAKTLTSFHNLSGQNSLTLEPDVNTTGFTGTGLTASAVLPTGTGSPRFMFDPLRLTDFHTKFSVAVLTGGVSRRAGQTLTHNTSINVVAMATRWNAIPFDMSFLSSPSSTHEHVYAVVYGGGNTTSPSGHPNNPAGGSGSCVDTSDDSMLLEQIPVAVSKTNAFSVGAGPKITVDAGGGGDSFGNTISGIDNPTINMYVGDTFTITNSAHATKAIYVKTEVVGGTALGLPTDSSVTDNGTGTVVFTPVSKGIYYYVDATDSRNYGIIQVHSRDIRNPFKSGTPVAITNVDNNQGDLGGMDNISLTIPLFYYVRNKYQHSGNESDAGRISLHTTKAGAENNTNRLDITGTTSGQTSTYIGIALRPVTYKPYTLNFVDTIAPTFISGTSSTILVGTASAGTVVYTANATDTGSGVSSYGLTNNTSGLSLSINSSSGEVSLTSSATIVNNQTYSFDVTATDGAGNTSTRSVTLTGGTASSTHTGTRGIYSGPFPYAGYGYWDASHSSATPRGGMNPVTTSVFSGATIRSVHAAHASSELGSNKFRFEITIEGDYTGAGSNPGTDVTITIGGQSQTLTFANATSVTHNSGSGYGFTIWKFNQSSVEPGSGTVWGKLKAANNGDNFTVVFT